MASSQSLKKQHLKAVIFRSYIYYFRKYYPAINIDALCSEAGLDVKYLSSDDNWVSILFEAKLMELIRQKADDKDLLKKVGAFGVQREVVGSAIHFLATKLLKLETLYESLPFVTSLFNKVMRVEIQNKQPGKLVLRISPVLENLNEVETRILLKRIPDFIENTVGYYEAIPTQKGLSKADVKVDELIVDNIPVYYLEVSYQAESNFLAWFSKLTFLFSGFIFFSIFRLCNFDIENSLTVGVGVSLVTILLRAFLQLRSSKLVAAHTQDTLVRLDRQYKSLHDARTSLARKLDESTAVNELVNKLITADSETEMFDNTIQTLIDTLSYDRALVFLHDKQQNVLKYENGFGFDPIFVEKIKIFQLEVKIDSADPNKISNVFRHGNSILIKDVELHLKTLLDKQSVFVLKTSNSKSFVAVPIRTSDATYGILIADCYRTDRVMTEDDCMLLTTVGRQLGIAIEKERANRELNNALEHSKRLAESYSRFVPWETLAYLKYNSVFDVKLGDGVEKYMTVLFSDIRDFTRLCETMTPQETLFFLNSYFGKLSPIIKKYGGSIDKFIGDCIMAFFENPQDAIKAAIDIHRAVVNYNIERIGYNKVEIRAGIGICQGPVVIGPLGFDRKMEMTVLSDTVNIAARLDDLCKKLGSRILVAGMDTRHIRMPKGTLSIVHGDTEVRGKETLVRVTEIVDCELVPSVAQNHPQIGQRAQEYLDRISSEVFRKKAS